MVFFIENLLKMEARGSPNGYQNQWISAILRHPLPTSYWPTFDFEKGCKPIGENNRFPNWRNWTKFHDELAPNSLITTHLTGKGEGANGIFEIFRQEGEFLSMGPPPRLKDYHTHTSAHGLSKNSWKLGPPPRNFWIRPLYYVRFPHHRSSRTSESWGRYILRKKMMQNLIVILQVTL